MKITFMFRRFALCFFFVFHISQDFLNYFYKSNNELKFHVSVIKLFFEKNLTFL